MQSEHTVATRFGDLLSEPLRNGVYKSKEHHGSGVKIVNMGELFGHPRLRDVPMKRLELTASELRKSELRKGDLLFARRSLVAEGAGKCSVVKEVSEPTTFESSIIRARPDPNKVDSDYLYYFFASPQGRELMRTILRQVAVSGITGSDLAELQIPLPSLSSQRMCAHFLETLDDRIDLLRQTNATLESIAQALFKSWFIDFDPVRAKAEGCEPVGIEAAAASLFPAEFEESTLGKIPKGWRVEPLGDWLTVLETGKRPKGGVGGIHCGVPSIGAESITRAGIYDFSKTKYIPDDFFAQMRSGILSSHDVLLYKDGGKPGIFLPRVSMFGDGFPFERCAINEHVFRLRVREPIGQEYLYFWIWSDAVMHELRHRGGKAAIPGINQSDVREQKLLIPSAQISAGFKELAKPMFSKIFGNARTVQTLEDLRDNLLPRVISGKVRLQAVKEQVEDALP